MRCQFCGWDNPQGKDKCEKCNKPLTNTSLSDNRSSADVDADNHSRPTDRQAANAFDGKKTVREGIPTIREEEHPLAPQECPKCGYTLEDGKCPSCGYHELEETLKIDSSKEDLSNEGRKTIRPHRKEEKEGAFTLTPISEDDGQPEGEAIPFEGNSVSLRRDNTDPKNSTITSQEQARITFTDGQWGIEDKSEYRTTFVQAVRKIELQSGDLILLGNQLYRFDS